MVQLSHSYITSGETIALNTGTTVSKVMSLFFNMLSRLVIAIMDLGPIKKIERRGWSSLQGPESPSGRPDAPDSGEFGPGALLPAWPQNSRELGS